MAETMLAMAWLCQLAAEDSEITGEEAALGVLAMAGHDMGHDGSRCLDGSLEARSAEIVGTIMAGTSWMCGHALWCATSSFRQCLPMHSVRPDPRATPRSLLCRLAREADVFASLLPELGWRLGFALRREWRSAGDPSADVVVSFTSRCRFLEAYDDHTRSADRIGLSASSIDR